MRAHHLPLVQALKENERNIQKGWCPLCQVNSSGVAQLWKLEHCGSSSPSYCRSTCHSLCSWPMLQQHGPARSALIGHLWASDPNRNWSGWSSLSLRKDCDKTVGIFEVFGDIEQNKTKREAWDRECMRIGMPWQIDRGYDYRYINAKCTFTAGAVVKWGLESVSQNLSATLLAYNILTCERDASIPSFKPILDPRSNSLLPMAVPSWGEHIWPREVETLL